MSKTPVAEQLQVNFRMPGDLRDRIRSAAERNNRSLNAELVAALEEKFPPPKQADFGDLFQELFDELNDLADQGEEDALKQRILRANLRLASAGHGRILFSYLVRDGNLIVSAQNTNLRQRVAQVGAAQDAETVTVNEGPAVAEMKAARRK